MSNGQTTAPLICPVFPQTDYRVPAGYDRTRNAEIGNKNIALTYLEEAYTTEHWLVRIYRSVNSAPSLRRFHGQTNV